MDGKTFAAQYISEVKGRLPARFTERDGFEGELLFLLMEEAFNAGKRHGENPDVTISVTHHPTMDFIKKHGGGTHATVGRKP